MEQALRESATKHRAEPRQLPSSSLQTQPPKPATTLAFQNQTKAASKATEPQPTTACKQGAATSLQEADTHREHDCFRRKAIKDMGLHLDYRDTSAPSPQQSPPQPNIAQGQSVQPPPPEQLAFLPLASTAQPSWALALGLPLSQPSLRFFWIGLR